MPYEMQSWSSSAGAWSTMDRDNIAQWKPKANALDAAVRCLVWTGLIGIPAMQVVDVETGLIVWRDSSMYPDAGPSVVPEWDAMVRAEARAELNAPARTERREQPTLF